MSKDFWKAVGIRALRSFIEGFVAVMPASFTAGMDVWGVAVIALETGAYAAVISAAMAVLTGLPEADKTVRKA